jgi:nicotinamide riboside kinase
MSEAKLGILIKVKTAYTADQTRIAKWMKERANTHGHKEEQGRWQRVEIWKVKDRGWSLAGDEGGVDE